MILAIYIHMPTFIYIILQENYILTIVYLQLYIGVCRLSVLFYGEFFRGLNIVASYSLPA